MSLDERKKREIEAILAEYELEQAAYHAWLLAWRERSRGFRCLQRAGGAK